MPDEFEVIDFNPQPIDWVDFEKEVAIYFEESLKHGDHGINPKSCRVRRKPAYFSRDRNSNINFDVAVEVFPKEHPEGIKFLWLIECKDYNHTVPVDDVEEFYAKMCQVGAHKGTIVTRIGFQRGGVEFARTHRIGLSTLNQRKYAVIELSQTSRASPWCLETYGTYWSPDGQERQNASIGMLIRDNLGEFNFYIVPTIRFDEFNKVREST